MKRLSAICMAFFMGIAAPASAGGIIVALNASMDAAKNGEAAFVEAFQEHLNANGMQVQVHPANSLGGEKERLDQVSQDLIQVNLAHPAVLFKTAPIVKSLYLPFVFSDYRDFDATMANGKIVNTVNDKIANLGYRLVAFNMRGGSVGLFNNKKPVATLEDVSGLRLRGAEATQIDSYAAWGAKGTVVSWKEVANAIQTGVADGYFNPAASAIVVGHTDMLTHFTPLDAGPSARVVLVSEDWYSGLSPEEKQIVDDAIAKGVAANRAWTEAWIPQVKTILEKAGLTITQLEDGERDRFVEATRPVWAKHANPEDLELIVQNK